VVVGGAAAGADVQLGLDLLVLAPSSTNRCQLTGKPCTGAPALGDCPSIPVINNNCTTGFVDIPIPIVEGMPLSAGGCTPASPGIPPSDCDCSPCTAIDAGDGVKAGQCIANGFCVSGDLLIPLETSPGNYTAGASGEAFTFGWAQPYPLNVDGTIQLPEAVFMDNPAPLGVRVHTLAGAVQCAGAVDSGGPDGVGVLGQASPTPASLLLTFLVP
jgi:hypothetical protein